MLLKQDLINVIIILWIFELKMMLVTILLKGTMTISANTGETTCPHFYVQAMTHNILQVTQKKTQQKKTSNKLCKKIAWAKKCQM